MTAHLDLNQSFMAMQDLFVTGLVTTVGSGASCALGLPGMRQLATHLRTHVGGVASTLSITSQSAWEKVARALDAGSDLEASLNDVGDAADLLAVIARETARCVGDAEASAIDEMVRSSSPTPMGTLLTHIASNNKTVDVITPNYDRLIEVSANIAGLGVDVMFYGHAYGRLDSQRSRQELLRPSTQAKSRATLSYELHPHIRVSKPHGSLDWYFVRGECIRSAWPIDAERRIIVPGNAKYAAGYNPPFDMHRQRATDALDVAKALLFFGYGFNDDHLQTHLVPARQLPTLIIAHTLSSGARAYIDANPKALGVAAATVDGRPGTIIVSSRGSVELAGHELWKLEDFNREVLGHG